MEFRKETINLISAEKVSGTDVYSPSGESLGEVKENVTSNSWSSGANNLYDQNECFLGNGSITLHESA